MKLRKGTPYKKRLRDALNSTPDFWETDSLSVSYYSSYKAAASAKAICNQKPEARKGRFVPSEVLCEYWPLGVLIEGEPIAGTAKAILLRIKSGKRGAGSREAWIPRSQIEGFCRDGVNFRAIIPRWLVDKTAHAV